MSFDLSFSFTDILEGEEENNYHDYHNEGMRYQRERERERDR
jgi:hypothetical protein